MATRHEEQAPGERRPGLQRAASYLDTILTGGRLIRASLSGALSGGRRHEYVVDDDISNGRELNKIPALSYKQNDAAPKDYHYVTEHVQYTEPVGVDTSLTNMYTCACADSCGSGKCKCCASQRLACWYQADGRLSRGYNLEAPEVIYECNAGCKCNPKVCVNHVIQRGSRAKFALIRTKSRGWGVRTLESLKRGTFVGVYSGELISGGASCNRQDDTYLFNLASAVTINQQPPADAKDKQDQGNQEGAKRPAAAEQQFVCDAKFFGNFTRFINHSCEPNVIGIRSFTGHQDPRFPYIAFFTNKAVPANTELTLNYGDNYWLVKCKRDGVYCLCKRPTCKFTRATFAQTLKEHKRYREQQRQRRQEPPQAAQDPEEPQETAQDAQGAQPSGETTPDEAQRPSAADPKQ